ncbi:Rieske 2Fe-2S domain-containing protein [Thermostaphylospora chromogena]|uniref:Ferredoxin subunit of nitrite reductase or a ring-hydroxylating dioxygenase n=1 Tax=Thermostaphylospora chromogena TaxID=35622 RepID=A0A1H1DEH3_9ACTN|nr:Rieske (2Fe-2S) protein [Thermostaphylospora chromogena]SDQ74628.1 Ferredoxin subunit of nitrite reductase or a ring-hydroxylating dioxygenase [Thermostaphylospora chromogena]
MKETVHNGRRRPRADMRARLNMAEWLEASPAMDQPIIKLAQAVRKVIRPGTVRDWLHGVPTGKPAHPPLTAVSIGCWLASAILDFTGADPRASRILVTTGLVNALPTAATGITDWSSLHREQQRVGLAHMVANIGAVAFYAGSLAMRLSGRERAGRTLGLAGLGAAALGGYLGGHMAYRQAAGANHAESVTYLMQLGWHNLCELKDLPDGRPVSRRLGYIELFVLRTGDSVSVLADRCAHLAGPLHQGRIVSEKGQTCVVCPWHGSTFRVSDGEVVHGPATAPQPAFETRIRPDGTVQVRPALVTM